MKNMIKIKKPLRIILIILAFVFLLCSVFVLKDVLGIKESHQTIISIPEGATLSQISEILEENDIIEYPKIFKIVSRSKNYVIQKGRHKIDRSLSYFDILEKLTKTPDAGYDNIFKVLIPEGYEIKDIANILEENGLCSAEKFIKETETGEFDYSFIKDIKRNTNRLEGYLFPAIYEIQMGESEHQIITKMLDKFEEVVIPLYEQSNSSFTLDEIVNLASIVEREAANDGERGLVASVFLNRLEKDMTFSSCATVQYILKERKKVLSVSDTKINSPYNTYKYKGFPPGPIASPGEASIRAALYPEKTDYLYFVAKNDGSGNVFSKTDTEHLRNVEKMQK